jgi:hypothetical protein
MNEKFGMVPGVCPSWEVSDEGFKYGKELYPYNFLVGITKSKEATFYSNFEATVYTKTGKELDIEYTCLNKKRGKLAIEFLENAIKQSANAPAVAQVSAADELKKFKELLDMGVITQEEFNAKKKQLLGL